MAKAKSAQQIKSLQMKQIRFRIVGISPLVVNKFSTKSMAMMAAKMADGMASKSKKNREARNFDEDFQNALHISVDGWYGVPANSFRAAMISACRLVGIKMTIAKLAIFVESEGMDVESGSGLVRIEGRPERFIAPVRNATGVADIRVRPMWRDWAAKVLVSYDADSITRDSIVVLMERAGFQVGICEGRPDSRSSCGMGWGRWKVMDVEDVEV